MARSNVFCIGAFQFQIETIGGVSTLIPIGNGANLLSVIIGVVISPQTGIQKFAKIKQGVEYADGYVWYGPVDDLFAAEKEFVAYKAEYERKYGPLQSIGDIWGIKADWEVGTAFVPYTELIQILDLAVKVRSGEEVDISKLACVN